MNQGLAFRCIIIITVAILIFNFENFPSISAAKERNNKDNSTDPMTFFLPLPFTSHIADQSISKQQGYQDGIIPFP